MWGILTERTDGFYPTQTVRLEISGKLYLGIIPEGWRMDQKRIFFSPCFGDINLCNYATYLVFRGAE